MSQDSFRPSNLGASTTVALTTSAAAFPLPQGEGAQVRIVNETTGLVRFGFGTSNTVPAGFSTTNAMSLPSAQPVGVFTLDGQFINQQGYIYAVAVTAGNLNLTRGSGTY